MALALTSRVRVFPPIALVACLGLAVAACADAPGTPGSEPDAGIASADANGSDGDPGTDPALVAAWHAHADAALEAMLLRYWSPSAAYLGGVAPADGSLTQYWTFAQAFDAVLDGVERTHGAKFGGWIDALYTAQDAKGWARDYYDDENWMALALIRAYDLEHDAKYLNRATSLFADIEAAWDTTCCGTQHGGLWWDRPHTQKATAANAGAVITAVRLAAHTNDPHYLAFAKQVYAYWHATMVDPSTFEVFDHVVPGGTIVKYKFTYNEGLMIGAAVVLYGATSDPAYLADANHIAGFMLAHETTLVGADRVLFDGTNSGCDGDCQQFKGIGFRYLQQLVAADPSQTAAAALLAASANAIWDHARNPSGLFAADWAGPTTTTSSIDADSSAVMAINLYAHQLGAYVAATATPTTRHEAEDATVHGIGLETAHAGFAGWAYVAGWNANGQWIDFHVTVATAGAYHLAMRYAAGAGDAARLVYINGANAVATQPFASTGSWDMWTTATTTITLPAGASTISVIYNSGLASKNYLNLDWVDVAP